MLQSCPLLKLENGNSFTPVVRTIVNSDGSSTSKILGPITTKEKAKKKNDVKPRSILLMALPNEHLLTFNQYKDAKTLFEAIQTRFGGNDATKKTQKTLLKQIQLAILGENISQEDLNLKFLRSLPSEWNTHVVVWRNKPDLETMSFDDLYNNFKIVEQEVKRTITSTSNSSSQNMAFVSALGITNEANTANVQVSTTNSPISSVGSSDSTANLSDATVYAFLANQPNGFQLVHEDLEQIHKDDLEEMDLEWKLALLSMRARRECKGAKNQYIRPRNQDNKNRNQDSSRKTVYVEDTSSKVMVAIDGTSFDWSFMADEEVPTNMALMAFSDSEIEILKKEKESNQIKIDNFENASKSLDKLIRSQISDNNRKGIGFESYNAVPPLPTGLFSPLSIYLSISGLEVFQKPKFLGYGYKANKSNCENSSNEIKKSPDTPKIKDWVSDCDEDESKVMVLKSDNVQHKPEQANQHRKMVQQLVMENVKKGTGQREVRLVWNNTMRVNHQNFSNSRRNFSPTTILTKSGIIPISAAKQSSSKAATSVSAARSNDFQMSHSLSRRLFHQQTTLKNKILNVKVNTVKVNYVNPTKGKRMISVVGKQGIKAVKSSACWVWRPEIKKLDHDDPQVALKDTGIFDSGCSRHMTSTKSYLIDYQDYDGGFVAFVGSSKEGKITRKGKIRTRKLDFEDVYFVKELKFTLFSVSQMCDRKNNVLFIETECLILSPDFKLPDESQVLVKVPKKNNMYSFDLKNVVPSKGLTYLFAKATNDESNCGIGGLKPPKRTSTSKTPVITLAAIRQLVADSVAAALEAQAANMENTDNTSKTKSTMEIFLCV
ncbi:hypothetical protein Tco_0859123 [Tanacetum coccineum]|uniref:Retrovirus-related Pol polyprotein from transposon TNT 1-94-like beta-barrel domain-containing protein n=1 Tax=Tanacetum coccineum TaxID=301880 RepID=A0ABQ5BB28_9ASTR